METIKRLINQLILFFVDGKLEKFGHVDIKSMKVNFNGIIEKSDPTAVLCALVKLMEECISDETCHERHVDLVTKCLRKGTKLMSSWGNEVDYELVDFATLRLSHANDEGHFTFHR